MSEVSQQGNSSLGELTDISFHS